MSLSFCYNRPTLHALSLSVRALSAIAKHRQEPVQKNMCAAIAGDAASHNIHVLRSHVSTKSFLEPMAVKDGTGNKLGIIPALAQDNPDIIASIGTTPGEIFCFGALLVVLPAPTWRGNLSAFLWWQLPLITWCDGASCSRCAYLPTHTHWQHVLRAMSILKRVSCRGRQCNLCRGDSCLFEFFLSSMHQGADMIEPRTYPVLITSAPATNHCLSRLAEGWSDP